jgi:hypothetical protein
MLDAGQRLAVCGASSAPDDGSVEPPAIIPTVCTIVCGTLLLMIDKRRLTFGRRYMHIHTRTN